MLFGFGCALAAATCETLSKFSSRQGYWVSVCGASFLFALVTLVMGYLGGTLSLSGAISCALTFAISDAAMLLAWARRTGKLKARR